MNLKIIYEDDDVVVVDKSTGVVVFNEPALAKIATSQRKKTLIDFLIEKSPELKNVGEAPRYGIVHRLDKDTSGILLVAKSTKSLIFLQKQFKNREVDKKYIALATGVIKEDSSTIETLIGRSPQDPRKQKAYPLDQVPPLLVSQEANGVGTSKREAITEYKVLQKFENYTLLEVKIKTGRKHQIRCHLAYIHHPIAGDKVYGFKDSPKPEGLNRQFLHASFLKITLPSGQVKEFSSDIPEELKEILNNLEK